MNTSSAPFSFSLKGVSHVCGNLDAADKVLVCDVGPCKDGKPLYLPLNNRGFYEQLGFEARKTLHVWYESARWRQNMHYQYAMMRRLAGSFSESVNNPLYPFVASCGRYARPANTLNFSYINAHVARLFGMDMIVSAVHATAEDVALNKLGKWPLTRPSLGRHAKTARIIPDIMCAFEIAAFGTSRVLVVSNRRCALSRDVRKCAHSNIRRLCRDTQYARWHASALYPGVLDPTATYSALNMTVS
jgi:hypothetical protein